MFPGWSPCLKKRDLSVPRFRKRASTSRNSGYVHRHRTSHIEANRETGVPGREKITLGADRLEDKWLDTVNNRRQSSGLISPGKRGAILAKKKADLLTY